MWKAKCLPFPKLLPPEKKRFSIYESLQLILLFIEGFVLFRLVEDGMLGCWMVQIAYRSGTHREK